MTGAARPSSVAALILAAGLGRRFGGGDTASKLTAMLKGRPLVRHVAEAALASRACGVLVVTGHAAEAVTEALQGLDCDFIHNAAYADGLASSLKAGIAALPVSASGALVLLGDMPLVGTALIDQMIAAFETQNGEADAVVPVRAGQWGNPVLLARSIFPDIAALDGDKGAKGLLRRSGYKVIECRVEDPGVEIDIDTPAMLDALAEAVQRV